MKERKQQMDKENSRPGVIVPTSCGKIEIRTNNEFLQQGLMGAYGDQVNWWDPNVQGPNIIKGQPAYYCEKKYGPGWRLINSCEMMSFLALFDQTYRIWQSNTWLGINSGLPFYSVPLRRQAQDLLGKLTGTDMSKYLLTTAVMLSSGLPMYGQAANINLGGASATSPAGITLTRACAKLRITLENPAAGADNAFIVENAAPYTLYAPGSPLTFSPPELIAYPQVALDPVAAGTYRGITYIYESAQPPRLKILTSIDGTAREYVAGPNFPLPVRGYLYDIAIRVLPSGIPATLELHARDMDGSRSVLTYKMTHR